MTRLMRRCLQPFGINPGKNSRSPGLWAASLLIALVCAMNDVTPAVADAGPNAPVAAGQESDATEAFSRMRSRFDQGGVTMYLLLVLSVVGVTFTLERLFHLSRASIVPSDLCSRLPVMWRAHQWDEIQKVCRARPCSFSRLVDFMVRHRNASVDRLAMVLPDMGWREMRPHLRRIYPLAMVATLAPLLGLFGTVVGMIEAFEQFRSFSDSGNPADFSDAISKALITTAFGLSIALPALAFHHFFKSLTQKLGDLLEQEVSLMFEEFFLLGSPREGMEMLKAEVVRDAQRT